MKIQGIARRDFLASHEGRWGMESIADDGWIRCFYAAVSWLAKL